MCGSGPKMPKQSRRQQNLQIIAQQQQQMHQENMARMQRESMERQMAQQQAMARQQQEQLAKQNVPPPVMVEGSLGDARDGKLKRRRSRSQEVRQASRGTRALRIPLNLGTYQGAGNSGSSLNIPK